MTRLAAPLEHPTYVSTRLANGTRKLRTFAACHKKAARSTRPTTLHARMKTAPHTATDKGAWCEAVLTLAHDNNLPGFQVQALPNNELAEPAKAVGWREGHTLEMWRAPHGATLASTVYKAAQYDVRTWTVRAGKTLSDALQRAMWRPPGDGRVE